MTNIDKKFYRVDKDFCHNRRWHYAGSFLDSDTDDMPEADVLAVCAHEEEPVWMYYSFAKSGGLNTQVLDGVGALEHAFAVALDMKAHEPMERQNTMQECGLIFGLEDANLLSESGRGIIYCEHFLLNW
jgi:hypothetical protein